MAELKPCPFCGKEPELITRGNEFTKKRSAEIYCKSCNTKMIVGAIMGTLKFCVERVSEKWNKRIKS